MIRPPGRCLCVSAVVAAAGLAGGAAAAEGVHHYRPSRRVPASLESVLRHLDPGADAFPEEKDAHELAVRLQEWSTLLRSDPRHARSAAELLLADDFRGARLDVADERVSGAGPALEIRRSRNEAPILDRDPRAFAEDLAGLVTGMDEVKVAEFLITALEARGEADRVARTEVRYDLVGSSASAWRLERVGRWRIDWRRRSAGAWQVTAWAPLQETRTRAPRPIFAEVTEAAFGAIASFRRQLATGLDEWLGRLDAVFMPGGMGHHGVSVGDGDGDGLDDLYVSQPAGLPNRLLRNLGDGTFADVTDTAGVGVLDSTSQSLFADVDNDGDQDLVLVTRTGLVLLVNDGTGRFTRVNDAFRFQGALRGSPTSIAMADYDRDGFLDLYLCTYAYFIGASEDKAGTPTPYHDARNGPPNLLLRNDGHGRFADATAESGLSENNDRFSFAAAWGDYDGDGWPDLLVANDFGRKNLYHNEGLKDGRVRFKDVAAAAGVEDFGAGMSASFLDYDNDGRLDIYLGNMWTAAGKRVTGAPGFKPDAPGVIRELYKRHARGNSLFRNRGDGTFEDVTLAAGAEMGRWAWSSDALDFDNDGFEDFYVANGMFTRGPDEDARDLDSFFWRQVTARSPLDATRGTPFDDAWRATNRLLAGSGSQAPHERNVALRNDGHGRFDDVSGALGLDLDQDGRSFAVFDYDRDGDADLVVMAARSAPQLRLFRNDFDDQNAALAVRLTGTKSSRDAVGARVTVVTDLFRRTRTVKAGSGFISQHSKELLFGLGKSKKVAAVEVQWPSGLVQSFADVPIGTRVSILEGGEGVKAEPFQAKRPPPSGNLARAPDSDEDASGTWLYRPVPAPDFTVRDLAGKEHSLASVKGHPLLLLFWSTAAPPALRALEDVERAIPKLSAAGALVLAASVDDEAEAEKVRLAAAKATFPVAVAGAEMAGTYSVLSRYLFDRREELRLPTLLLLDPHGQVVKVYRDRIDAAAALADLSKIDASPADRLTRALPFPGIFATPPGERNDFQLSLDLAEQGFERAAIAGFERVTKVDPSAIAFYNLGTLAMKAGHPVEAKAAFERALKLEPDHAEASNSLGALLAQGGDVAGAIVRFRAALESRPQFPDALNNLGFALFQTEHDQDAHDLYQKALAIQPDFPEALNNLGIYYGQRGDLAEAESCFERAVAARADYGEAANNLALVLAARGDVPGATTLLQRFLEKAPGFEPSYVTLAKVYLGAGRRREGVQVLELLLQRNPKNEMALQMIAPLRPAR